MDADDNVQIPPDWSAEATRRLPEFQAGARERTGLLLAQTVETVGRSFKRSHYPMYLYLCPWGGGAIADPAIFPFYPFLESAVGAYRLPVELFSDWILFHEILHVYVLEKIDYSVGTPILNTLYTDLIVDESFFSEVKAHLGLPRSAELTTQQKIEYVALVLTHLHLDGVMMLVYKSLNEMTRFEQYRQNEIINVHPHPSYVRAWNILASYDDAKIAELMAEIR